jgi:hypothetical protein
MFSQGSLILLAPALAEHAFRRVFRLKISVRRVGSQESSALKHYREIDSAVGAKERD